MSDLVADAATQAVARIGGELGAAISEHLWAVERLRPLLASDDVLGIVDHGVLASDRLARAVLAQQQHVVPDRADLVRTATSAVTALYDSRAAGSSPRASEIVAAAVDAVLDAVLDRLSP